MVKWTGVWITKLYVTYTDGSTTVLTAQTNLWRSPFVHYPKFPEEFALDLLYIVQWYNVLRVNVCMYTPMAFCRY